MLDVHAPHEKMHGLGDFLSHLLTITVGLLTVRRIDPDKGHLTSAEAATLSA